MSKTQKPNKGGRPKVDTEAVTLRISREILGRLDEWRAQQRPIPSRQDAIRAMVEATLRMMGDDDK